ncbi:MAG: dnaX [Acidimicrobiales bacterium]|nr:dnaX [Acidimicrobiales bacterium]
MTYQSLYRRFRPQRFAEVRGQEPIVTALRNAVREGRVAHAYLFSGPRGTGKTSTARILAKALNCENPIDGEPCNECRSCTEIRAGSSLDVHELDAASNNGVDAMRDLVSRAALGSPGRWKVYIVDEVHMLSAAASNALLKTLEEPPGHVVFVLATTDPQKVLPTIKSRTQHYEFRLLPAEILRDLLMDVESAAGLSVAPEAIDIVVRRGRGSARDALSVLDQVAAAGAVEADAAPVEQIVDALCDRDAAAALVAVAERINAGHDPRQLTSDIVTELRQVFLATMAKGLVGVPDDELVRLEEQARRLGAPALVRAMETLGTALVDMREAPDPRVLLEVALVRMCKPEADASPAALLERIERLERGQGGGPPSPAVVARPATVARPSTKAPTSASGSAPPSGKVAPPPSGERAATPAAEPIVTGTLPTRDELALAWGDHVLGQLSQKARVRFGGGRFVGVEGGKAVFGVSNSVHRSRCEEVRPEAEAVLARHFGRPVPLSVEVVADTAPPRDEPEPDAVVPEPVDVRDLQDAPPPTVTSPVDHVIQAFEGAEVVED